MGFETPTDLWLRGRYAGEARRRLLAPGPAARVARPRRARAPSSRTTSPGGAPIGLQVWRWLSLEAWARRFVAGDPRLGLPPEAERNAGAHRSYVERARVITWTPLIFQVANNAVIESNEIGLLTELGPLDYDGFAYRAPAVDLLTCETKKTEQPPHGSIAPYKVLSIAPFLLAAPFPN